MASMGHGQCPTPPTTGPMPNAPFSGAITQRGLMKSGTQPLKKGDGAGGGGNQTKGTFYFLPRTTRAREKKTKKPQPFVYLSWRASCLGIEAWLSQGRSQLCCPTLGSGSGWLCPGSQHCPGAAASLWRLGKRHPRCLHKCVLTNVNSPS